MSAAEKRQTNIQLGQCAKADDFEDLTDLKNVRYDEFIKWFYNVRKVIRFTTRDEKDEGDFRDIGTRKSFRAFAKGFDLSEIGVMKEAELMAEFEKWHSTLMPKRYAHGYRHNKMACGRYEYENTEKSYCAFFNGYKAGIKVRKENI